MTVTVSSEILWYARMLWMAAHRCILAKATTLRWSWAKEGAHDETVYSSIDCMMLMSICLLLVRQPLTFSIRPLGPAITRYAFSDAARICALNIVHLHSSTISKYFRDNLSHTICVHYICATLTLLTYLWFT